MNAIGIIWNMGNQYCDDILDEIDSKYKIHEQRKFHLINEYDNFVLDCYDGDSEAFLEGYIYEKIKSMKTSPSTDVTIFEIEIENASFKNNPDTNEKQCVETKQIKTQIREKYSSLIKGYFFDNLIHITDNEAEYKTLVNMLPKYVQYEIK